MPNHKSNRKCSIDGCERKHQARGWCKQHWQRWSRNGDPLADVPLHSVIKAFLATAASFADREACRPWPFGMEKNGYGTLNVDGKHYNAHHYICIMAHGDRPSEIHQAAHNCGNRACVNPHHLRWATPKQNNQDKIAHGTVPRGEDHCHSKLTDAQVVEIRELAGEFTHAAIGQRFNVSQSTVSGIISGKHRIAPAGTPIGQIRISDDEVHASITEGTFGDLLALVERLAKREVA